MPQLGKSATAYSGLLILSVVWGMAFVAIKQADTELSPVNLALLRWLVACVPFLVLLPIIGRPKIGFERRDIPRLLVVALATWRGTTSPCTTQKRRSPQGCRPSSLHSVQSSS